MKRLALNNLNTPEYFNKIWADAKLHCHDSGRSKIFLQEIRDGDTVLELGCGKFGFLEYWGDNKQYFKLDHIMPYALDFSSVVIEHVASKKLGISLIQGNVLDTKFPAEFFEFVGAGEVIEHMEEPEKLVLEMARVCKSDGSLMISTLDPDHPGIDQREYPEHLWKFAPEDLIGFFTKYGKTKYFKVGPYHFIHCVKK